MYRWINLDISENVYICVEKYELQFTMGRICERKVGYRSYKDYNKKAIEKILEKIVDSIWSINKASKEFKIPYGILFNKYKGLHTQKHGGQTVFSKQEEEAIIKSVVSCSDWDFTLCVEDLQMVTKSLFDKEARQVNRFKNNSPDRDWVYLLIKRHKSSLTQRMGANIKRAKEQYGRRPRQKEVATSQNHCKSAISIMFSGSASGTLLPPYVI